MSLSFPTISSSGPNGAIIHYCPTSSTARKLSVDEIYLCDSGAQYLDGTTDVTRTVSFGQPKPKEKVTFCPFAELLSVHCLCVGVFYTSVEGAHCSLLSHLP